MNFLYPLNKRRFFFTCITIGIVYCSLKVALQPFASDSLTHFRAENSPLRIYLLLSGWQLSEHVTIPVEPKQSRYDRVVGRDRYIYYQGTRKLTVDLRDVQNTSGDIGSLREKHLAAAAPALNQLDLQIHNIKAGSYQTLIENGQTTMHTCFNANGRFSTTASEFRQNSYYQTLEFQHWQGWIMGHHPIITKRCFWLQIALQDTSDLAATQSDKLFAEILQDFVVYAK